MKSNNSLNKAAVKVGVRDLSVYGTHWREIDETYSFVGKKHILYFPGGGVASSKQSNGDVKRIIKTLEKAGVSNVPVLSVYYENVSSVLGHRVSQLKELCELKDTLSDNEQEQDPYYLSFFETYFAPLITDREGKRLSIEKAKENMSNLLIVGHCYGSTMVFEMELQLQKRMEALGYMADERAKIQQKLVVLSYASRIPVGVSKSTILHITSLSDPQKGKEWKAENFQEFLNTKNRETQKTAYVAWNEHEVILAADKLLLCSVEEHDVIACFDSVDDDVEKTAMGQNVTRVVRSFLKQTLLQKEQGNLSETLFNLPKVSFLKTAQKNGQQLFDEYRGYLKRCQTGRKKLFDLIQQKDVVRLEKLGKNFKVPFSLQNEVGDFPIHAALKTGETAVVETVVRYAPCWFQSLNSEKKLPVVSALSMGDFKMAAFLWTKMQEDFSGSPDNNQSRNQAKNKILLWVAQKVSRSADCLKFFDFIATDTFALSSQEILSLIDSRQSIGESKSLYLEKQLTALASIDTFLISYLREMNERDLFAKTEVGKETLVLIDVLDSRLKDSSYQQLIKQRRETFAMNNKISLWGKQRGA